MREGRYGGNDDYVLTRPGLTPQQISQVQTGLAQNLSSTVTTQQITANQNDFPIPPGVTLLRVDVDSTQRTITGFSGGGGGDRHVVIRNVGAANILLTHEDASSQETNRLKLPLASGLIVAPQQSATITYDLTDRRWTVIDERSPQAVTTATITANQNDYPLPGGAALVRIVPDNVGPKTFTGFAGGVPGRVVSLLCAGPQNIILSVDDAASVAENRFLNGTAFNTTITPAKIATIIYDGVDSRWRLVSLSP